MKIGLTYDLRSDYLEEGYSPEETAEFDKESTVAGIEQSVRNAGHETERIGNSGALIKQLYEGRRWDMVFNIAEGLYGEGRESLIPALLDSYKIPYVFSGPVTLGISLNKGFAKQIIRDSCINTPDFCIVSKTGDISAVDLSYPLFAKPVSEGTGKGIDSRSKISSPDELESVCKTLLKKFNQPVLVEEYLPGREFTVGVLGSGRDAYVPGAMEIVFRSSLDTVYSYENKENYEDIVDYRIVEGELLEECRDIALSVWKALNCLDGGRVDLKIDRHGKMSFIEINPLAGLNPECSDLPILCRLNGISYQEIINEILNSAVKRNFPHE